MLLKYIKPRLLQSSMISYGFCNKGFGNFNRNKKPQPKKQQTNTKSSQSQNKQTQIHHSNPQNKSNFKGFESFKRKPQAEIQQQTPTGSNPFNKQLFEKLKKNIEELRKQQQIMVQSLMTAQTKNEKKSSSKQEPQIESEEDDLFPQTKTQEKNKGNRIPRYKLSLLLLLSGFGLATSIYYTAKLFLSNDPKEIIYSDVFELVKNDKVKSISIMNATSDQRSRVNLLIETVDGEKFRSKTEEQELLLKAIGKQNQQSTNKIRVILQPGEHFVFDRAIFKNALGWVINIGLVLFILRSMGSAGTKTGAAKNAGKGSKGMFSMQQAYGKDNKVRKTINVKFKDVAGMNTPKKQITEFVQFLKHPQKFRRLGARIPRGALLTGPPGTGKTLLAKACAGQSKVSFFSTSGSQFVEKFVGVGAARVRHLFAEAKASAPSIIFIDEIDAVGRKRWKHAIGGNDERDSTLNQLLVEMDGFGTQENVVVFAATNRKEMLDDALLRPGRFDRIIQIQLPDLEERYEMFLVHLSPLKLHESISNISIVAQRMSMLTPGFSGADIFNVCNEAAILAARNNRDYILMIDFENACDRIIAGTVKRNVLSEEERKIVAYHQSGHAVVSWFLEGANPLLKLTIVPRSKGSLGFAQYLPSDKKIFSKQNIIDQLTVILGGRAAEMEFFGKLTTGAADDLQKASELAYNMIKQYGMGVNLFNRRSSETEYMKQYSEYTSSKIDTEVRNIVLQALNKSKQLIKTHKQKINTLAQLLLKENTLDTTQIQGILGERPFKQSQSYKNFLSKV